MFFLAFLGFTNIPGQLSINDKLLHFICFCIATGVFYFIFDVDEDARRVWLWRHSGLIITLTICFFVGGVMSEVVQSMLPYHAFQVMDVVANLGGCSIGLYVVYNLERYHRYRREIARLYRPLDSEMSSDEEDPEDSWAPSTGTQLLPTHYVRSPSQPQSAKSKATRRLMDVWDEREELFGVGATSDDEEDRDNEPATMPRPPKVPTPEIRITHS